MKLVLTQFILNDSNETVILLNDSLSTISSNINTHTETHRLTRILQLEKIIIYSILFIISSIGNTSSFITLLLKKKNAKSRVRLLFLNLCVADLLVTKKKNSHNEIIFKQEF